MEITVSMEDISFASSPPATPVGARTARTQRRPIESVFAVGNLRIIAGMGTVHEESGLARVLPSLDRAEPGAGSRSVLARRRDALAVVAPHATGR